MACTVKFIDPSSTIPDLEVNIYSEGYQRNRAGRSLTTVNRAGWLVESGNYYGGRFWWQLNLTLDLDDGLRLDRYLNAQKSNVNPAGRDYLIFEDYAEYVPLADVQTVTIVPGTTRSVDGLLTGNGRFACRIFYPENDQSLTIGQLGTVTQVRRQVNVYQIVGIPV